MINKKWIKIYFIAPAIIIAIIFSINFIVDPYSMTKYNILNIPNKFARDDRVEKVNKLKSSPRYDNIILGSSRVYVTNPLMVSRYLSGTTYNCGVGTARVEDHLGFILLLQRLNKLPKNLIIGLDFYTFNEEVETNKYFLKNDDLNFLNNSLANKSYISNFLSVSAFRASYKTLKNFLKNDSKQRFDINGASHNASKIFNYYKQNNNSFRVYTNADILKELNFIKTINYSKISNKRINYLQNIIDISKDNDINLYFYLTPIYGELLSKIQNDINLNKSLIMLRKKIANKTSFYDFTYHNKINDNAEYFGDLTHVTTETGNLVYARIFNDKNISLPSKFGVYTKAKAK